MNTRCYGNNILIQRAEIISEKEEGSGFHANASRIVGSDMWAIVQKRIWISIFSTV